MSVRCRLILGLALLDLVMVYCPFSAMVMVCLSSGMVHLFWEDGGSSDESICRSVVRQYRRARPRGLRRHAEEPGQGRCCCSLFTFLNLHSQLSAQDRRPSSWSYRRVPLPEAPYQPHPYAQIPVCCLLVFLFPCEILEHITFRFPRNNPCSNSVTEVHVKHVNLESLRIGV